MIRNNQPTCRFARLLLLLTLVWVQLAVHAAQPALNDYSARLMPLRAQLPAVIESAGKAAEQVLAHPEAQLNLPYWEQMSFAEELINRAGGLALANTPVDREPTRYDIVLLSVRSWENNTELIRRRLQECKARGWTVTVIGSAAGKPQDLGADFFIDNGAPSGAAEYGRINVLANVTLGWMWCCEYAAAMSRQGKFPAILYSIAMPGAAEYDASIQTRQGRRKVVDSPKAIPAGELATAYLQRVGKLVDDLRSARTQEQLAKAADVVAQRMAGGGMVAIAGMGHVIIEEVMAENKTPWYAFRGVGMVDMNFEAHLKKGDLLIWMTYAGMNSVYDDYAKYIAETGADLITSYAPDPEWAKNPPATLAHIDQSWALPDAEVPIPVYPNAMAPVSGLNVTLLARMLDDEVSARLASTKAQPKIPARSLPPEFIDRAGREYYPDEPEYRAPRPVRQWGFIDASGKPVVPMEYDAVQPVNEGLAAVQKDGKWGFIDAAGRVVVAPRYDTVSMFHEGLAKVGLNGKFGYIDKAGKVAVPLQYDGIEDVSDSFWFMRANPWFATFGPVAPTRVALVRQGKNWGIIDKSGKVILPVTNEAVGFYSDKALVVKRGGKFGLVSATGQQIVAPKYDNIGRFRRGYATFELKGKTGALDSQGREIVPAKYDGISSVAPNLVVVRIGRKWGGVTRAGAEVFPPKYDQVRRFRDGIAQVRAGGLQGAIDEAGREIVPVQFSGIDDSTEGLIPVERDGKWGYYNMAGKLVIPTQLDAVAEFQNGVAFVKQGGKQKLIDKTGAPITLPHYDYYADAGEGLIKIVRDGKWGIVDRSGREIAPPQYSYVVGFREGRALVATGGEWREDYGKLPMLIGAKWGLIDTKGREVVAPRYDRIMPQGESMLAVGRNVELVKPIP